MPTAKCFYCSVDADLKSLKKCGACGGVMYCSKECQKLSWKATHRFTCSPMSNEGFEELDRRLGKIIDSWQHAWRGVLERYCVAALDLANNPGRDVTHCAWMELRFTGASSHARRFELVVGKVDSIADILRRHPGLTTLRDPPHLVGERIHYAMVFHFDQEGTPARSLMRSRAWTDLCIKPDQTRSAEAKRRSKEKAEGVFDVAKKAFESGNPDEIRNEVTVDALMEFMT